MLNTLSLFTDGSVNTQTGIGYGAYLVITELTSNANLAHQIKTKKFDNTSSTKLELQTLLWALSDIPNTGQHLIIYTDCQNIITLPQRRDRLEKNNYHSKKHIPLNNAELYRQFFNIIDNLSCEFVKVQGHKKSAQKTNIDKTFSQVDQAARKALRTG